MKHQKKMTLMVAILLVISMLAGCASGGGSSEQAPVQADTPAAEAPAVQADDTQEQITLVQWDQDPSTEAGSRAVIEAFKKVNPNITIELEVKTTDQYPALLSAAFQAGAAPDIFFTNGTKDNTMPSLLEIDALMDLTPHVDISKFDVGLCANLYSDGKLYVTPGPVADSRTVYYNKDMFIENGWTLPEDLKNLADFEALCEQIRDSGKVMAPISVSVSDGWACCYTMDLIVDAVAPDWKYDLVRGNAKHDDERLYEAFATFEKWAEAGYFGSTYQGNTRNSIVLEFAKGDSAMMFNGTNVTPTILENNPDMDLGAFLIPGTDGKKAITLTPNMGYSANKNTKYQEAVIEVLNFYNSEEALQLRINALGGIPCRSDLEAPNEVVAGMMDADLHTNGMVDLMGRWPKDGMAPRNTWHEDVVKWVGGQLSYQDFLNNIMDQLDYSKVGTHPADAYLFQ